MSSDSVVYHKLSKTYAHKKGAKKEPPDARLFACIRGLADYTCEGRDAYHYLFVVQTNSGTGANHYLFVVQTNSGTGANHYSFVVQTYSGSRVD